MRCFYSVLTFGEVLAKLPRSPEPESAPDDVHEHFLVVRGRLAPHLARLLRHLIDLGRGVGVGDEPAERVRPVEKDPNQDPQRPAVGWGAVESCQESEEAKPSLS